MHIFATLNKFHDIGSWLILWNICKLKKIFETFYFWHKMLISFERSWDREPVWPDFGIKIIQIFLKVAQIVATSVSSYNDIFQNIPKKLPKFFGYFCKRICCQKLSKITQSGHTTERGETSIENEPPTLLAFSQNGSDLKWKNDIKCNARKEGVKELTFDSHWRTGNVILAYQVIISIPTNVVQIGQTWSWSHKIFECSITTLCLIKSFW